MPFEGAVWRQAGVGQGQIGRGGPSSAATRLLAPNPLLDAGSLVRVAVCSDDRVAPQEVTHWAYK